MKTYEGILEIGSPAWCLKTKSNWDLYQRKYTQQWVVVDNRYKSKLLTPKTTSLSESYSHMPSILILDEEYPRLLYPYKKKTTILPAIIGGYSKPLVDSYAKNSKSDLYVGIKLKNGIVSEEEANIGSVGKIDKWIIFDKGDRYLCVNLNPPNEYMIPTLS